MPGMTDYNFLNILLFFFQFDDEFEGSRTLTLEHSFDQGNVSILEGRKSADGNLFRKFSVKICLIQSESFL